MSDEDQKLWEAYLSGFNDELDGTSSNPYLPETLEFRAYVMGGVDAIVGDDCPSLDYRPAKVILDIIKKMDLNL